jgi:hypothetical protein
LQSSQPQCGTWREQNPKWTNLHRQWHWTQLVNSQGLRKNMFFFIQWCCQ